jgi:uncharacterized membrane protein YbhN (UPF0104 family)
LPRSSSAWHRVGVVASLLILIAAMAVLFHVLRDIDFGKTLDAITSTSVPAIVASAAFVVLGYVTLTFYDYFSLQTIGRRDVPYRIAAMAGFVSYSIGHNLGATVFTAGAVRWRIYSRWNLTLVDIARIAFVTGLTFWLGNVVVLGTAMIVEPEAASAVDQLPPIVNQYLGVIALVVIGGYLLWLLPRPRVIGRGSWKVILPNARLTLVQIGIGVLDLSAGSLAFFMLLPGEPSVDFITVMVVFVTAMLLGFVSHTPGGLGVFDAAILVALPQFSKEELLASLLIFRLLYFVLPLLIAVSILAIREALLARAT